MREVILRLAPSMPCSLTATDMSQEPVTLELLSTCRLSHYTLSAVQDPVQQNQTLEFDVTVQNVSTSSQSVTLDWTVPQYTSFGGLQAGTAQSHNFGTLTSGQSITYVILLTVLPIASAPDGANITLDMFDLPRGASVSRTVAVNPHTLATPTPTPTPGTPTPTPRRLREARLAGWRTFRPACASRRTIMS